MSNKYNFGGRSIFNQPRTAGSGKIFHYAIVESVDDPSEGNRIIARIKGIDDAKRTSNIPYSFPLLQKFFHVVPKVGETVMVFVPDLNNPSVDRMYVGPIISQPQRLSNDPHLYTSRSLLDSSIIDPLPAPSTVPENKGVYPKTEDVALQGRDNTDIIFREKEILIRAGKFEVNDAQTTDDTPKFNKENPAYIQLKHNVTIDEDENKSSVVNVVGGKINLLSHKDGQPRFTLNDQDSMITDEELLNILENAHPLAFGDLLVEYLRLQRAAFINHVHPYHGKKPQDLAGAEDIDKYLDFDLNRILSKNVRTN